LVIPDSDSEKLDVQTTEFSVQPKRPFPRKPLNRVDEDRSTDYRAEWRHLPPAEFTSKLQQKKFNLGLRVERTTDNSTDLKVLTNKSFKEHSEVCIYALQPTENNLDINHLQRYCYQDKNGFALVDNKTTYNTFGCLINDPLDDDRCNVNIYNGNVT
jgi:hypothetical protein